MVEGDGFEHHRRRRNGFTVRPFSPRASSNYEIVMVTLGDSKPVTAVKGRVFKLDQGATTTFLLYMKMIKKQ